jgi:protein SCO1/2
MPAPWSFRSLMAALGLMAGVAAMAETPGPSSLGREALREIRFEQKLNNPLSRDLEFRDETGTSVSLGRYVGHRPVLLILGYYDCPMLCTLVLNGLTDALQDLKPTVGNQFEVVMVSIDARETATLAAAKKRTYLRLYGRQTSADGWHFLTGEDSAIRRLADEVGFRYAYDSANRQYAHPSGVVLITSDGRVGRYFFGVHFSAVELSGALGEARGNRIGARLEDFVLMCFHYQPLTGRYGPRVVAVVRWGGALTALALLMVMLRVKAGGAGPARPVSTGTGPGAAEQTGAESPHLANRRGREGGG